MWQVHNSSICWMLEWRQKLDDWARRGSGGDAYTRWEVRVGHLKGLFQPRLWASDSENWWTLFPIIGGWCPLHKPPLTSYVSSLLPHPSPLFPSPWPSISISWESRSCWWLLSHLSHDSIPVFLFPPPWFISSITVLKGIWASTCPSRPFPALQLNLLHLLPKPSSSPDVAHTAFQDLSRFHFPTCHLHPTCPVPHLHRDLLHPHPFSFLFSVPKGLSHNFLAHMVTPTHLQDSDQSGVSQAPSPT